ncbi:protoheme IX farnesyltransferase [Mizugakiibacter sediminis]|uniref:Protoheme IX farnesyltransferase n=1 Tax=Mizugakiibacter sediminis TaxID=1475481 RepID=A0A0K8QK70_9GAMM|nr:heme o synthase [Mizugakiibacter sediminis]GAP65340.1 protoheme IX farnesyltransferase [Mizugakiibacter sediminis]
MLAAAAAKTHAGAAVTAVVRQYWALTKPRIVALLVFCAVIGMFLAVPGLPPWRALLLGTLGIWLASASAAALNQLIDQRIDRVMARTAHRPLASGALQPRQVIVFALILGAASMLVLALWVNVLTAVLTFAGLIGYAVVYTAFLKRATPQNIVIGGIAGAVPPVLGWTAVTGQLHPYALLLCLIIFVWTPPHFWALAIFRRDDYARACVPMLPVVYGVEYTRWHVLFYTVLLVLVTLLPYLTGMSGVFYLGGAAVLGGGFLYYAIRLMNPPDERFAMKVFGYSIVYLMALFAFLLLDHWLVAPALQGGFVYRRIG